MSPLSPRGSGYNRGVVISGVNIYVFLLRTPILSLKAGQMLAQAPILVVDDDPGLRTLVAAALELEGHSVLTAPDGFVALTFLDTFQPLIILLDKAMPGMDGPRFARELRARGFTVPIVVISGSEDGQLFAQEIHAEGFIAKPFKLPQLVATIEGVLARDQQN